MVESVIYNIHYFLPSLIFLKTNWSSLLAELKLISTWFSLGLEYRDTLLITI